MLKPLSAAARGGCLEWGIPCQGSVYESYPAPNHLESHRTCIGARSHRPCTLRFRRCNSDPHSSIPNGFCLRAPPERDSTSPYEVWAYGTVGHRDDQLFKLIAAECVPRLEEFKTQESRVARVFRWQGFGQGRSKR